MASFQAWRTVEPRSRARRRHGQRPRPADAMVHPIPGVTDTFTPLPRGAPLLSSADSAALRVVTLAATLRLRQQPWQA
jgi:hypothetical protein